ncbi:MAG: helix-turn-helix domain-containing protein [Clostridiales bacterium]|nr:helix-turn-helix domain-containing protein [Clostridiales bacterium]
MNLSATLGKLRTDLGISQEKLAELVGVSRQAVQKWESGTAAPDLDNLMKISRCFNISLDALAFDSDKRTSEELKFDRKLSPQYSTLHEWENYSTQLNTELVQSLEEGKDIAQYEDVFRAAAKLPKGDAKKQIADVLFEVVLNAGTRAGYTYNEPSDLETIKILRPNDQPEKRQPNTDKLYSKIYGAWVGRTCGCLLGKPIEGIRTNELVPLLKQTGNYPMKRYILNSELTDDICDQFNYRLKNKCYPDNISFAPVDDDTNYTVLASVLIDRYGVDFTPWDVSRIWLDYQPKNAYCTAERVAFCNFVKGYNPPESAIYKNPYREWIGAQIRADYFGYINPGNPELAAEMAWRDASISHIKNGIYGEMFAAAMIAEAAVNDDIHSIIETGLSQIPEGSRLTEDVKAVIAMFDDGKSSEDCFAMIHKKWDEYTGHGWCHTISNAMIVTAALLYGGNDYGRSICLAVQTGFDTDCNGATVGSILGMKNGIEGIQPEWYAPINDTLDTSIFGVGKVKLSDMAAKTLKIATR